MTASLLPKEAIDKARQMIKENKSSPSSTVEGNEEMTQLKAQMESFEIELQQLKNQTKEEPSPTNKRKGFFF